MLDLHGREQLGLLDDHVYLRARRRAVVKQVVTGQGPQLAALLQLGDDEGLQALPRRERNRGGLVDPHVGEVVLGRPGVALGGPVLVSI